MRWIMASLGILLSTAMLAISGLMNWRFGYTLGQNEFHSHLFGALSASADGFKALAPVLCFSLWSAKQRLAAFAGATFWTVLTVYSLTSAIGFGALNRDITSAARQSKFTVYQDLRNERVRLKALVAAENDERKRLSDKLAALAWQRPQPTIQAEIEAAHHHRRWQSSKQCVDATATESIAFCQDYRRLQGELLAAAQTSKVRQETERRLDELLRDNQTEHKIEKINAQIRTSAAATIGTVADPQIAQFAELLPYDPASINLGLTILVAVVSEIGSSLGFFITFAAFRAATNEDIDNKFEPRQSSPAPSAGLVQKAQALRPTVSIEPITLSIQDYIRERIEASEGSTIVASHLYADFACWCDLVGAGYLKTTSTTKFGIEMGRQFSKARQGGKIKYFGIRFKRGPLAAT